MRDMLRNDRQFDVLALDPPKLIHSREELEEGRRTHFDLNRLALQLVRPGGIMVTFTCAGLLTNEEFDKLVRSAARQAGPPMPGTEADENPRRQPREIQIFDRTGASADHPVAGSCPESEYLRAMWLRVL
jgi:23S rRNA (cytosine1962-C5)-methyltransferase